MDFLYIPTCSVIVKYEKYNVKQFRKILLIYKSGVLKMCAVPLQNVCLLQGK